MNDYILHLIGEMSKFLLDSDPSRLVISLHKESDGLHLSVMDNNPRGEEELAKLVKTLNPPKRPEFADYYGSMAGHDLLGRSRLNLVGWQVKQASVERIEGGTKIDLWLGGDRFNPSAFNMAKPETETRTRK